MPIANLRALGERPVDLLVIGGGIIGAGVARDAALRGLSVALVEQGDFASGTSSKTSKLIHGGLRYLEQGRFRLVFESSRERRLLTRLAPHLVAPQTFLAPVYRGDARGRVLMHLGLTLYDCLALFHNSQFHRCLGKRRVLRLEPALAPAQLQGGALFGDSQMRDARLVLENALDAAERGAVCENYVAITALLTERGRLAGAVLEDVATRERATVRARVIVNATGPWSDTIRRLSDPDAPARIRPSRGIHLVVPARGLQHLLLISVPEDRRVMFVQPWEGYTLIGTTDAEQPAGQPVHASADEVAYLLAHANRVLAGPPLTRDDVLATFAGVRPLLQSAGSLASLSREHAIEVDRQGLISLLGGTVTTYRVLAERVVDRVCQALGRRLRCHTDAAPLFGGRVEDPQAWLREHAREALGRGLSQDAARHLVRTYGVRSQTLFRWIAQDSRLIPTLCPHHPHVAAEVRYAFEVERAQTLNDFLFRRTWIAFSACHGRDGLPRIESIAREHLPALARRFDDELRAYDAELAAMTAFRRDV